MIATRDRELKESLVLKEREKRYVYIYGSGRIAIGN